MIYRIDTSHIFGTSHHLSPKVKHWSCSHFGFESLENALNFGQLLLFSHILHYYMGGPILSVRGGQHILGDKTLKGAILL